MSTLFKWSVRTRGSFSLDGPYSATRDVYISSGPAAITGTLAAQEHGQDGFTATGELVPLGPTGTLAVQEAGQDSFAGTAALDPQLPVYVSPIAIQEQGQDGFAASGELVPQTYQVEYWDEDTPETVTTITDILDKNTKLTGLEPAKNYGWKVRAYLSENFFSDWAPPGLVTTPTSWMDVQEVGLDIFFGVSQYQYLEVQEQGADVFAGTGELGAAPIDGTMAVQEAGADTASVSGQVAISCNMAAQETTQDTPTVTVTVTVTAVLSTQEELYDVLAAAGAVAVAAALEAQEEGQDTFSGTMKEITVGVPFNLRVTAATRTSLRFEWDEPV